ncbi:Gfo/Idh/MocA family protein [Microbacterium sp. 18062]|uniref:Gfo/Idh/MocA family protein n=1 Tax=Microbacterium sp. 18062 TaxID=2681410 RepID=UPI00135C26F4|nr:Gfo/Idh/MocA family oxidoreductase [Microbacterium sp. 18062]
MLTIGIVGAGLRGRLFAEALRDQPGVTVVGFAEPSDRVAEQARAATGLPVLPSHTELFSDLDPDAVIIATPDFAHRDAAIDAARGGRHILVEKPLATTLEDAHAIAEEVRAGGGRCLVGFENRWNPHVVKAHGSIARGELGAPITSSAVLSNSYFVPTQMLSWAGRSSPAWFLMPHTLDMLTWFIDSPVASVSAVVTDGILAARGVATSDVVHALVTFESGATANLTSAWVLPDGGQGIVDFRFELIGTAGSVSADLAHQGLTFVTDRSRSEWPLSGAIGRAPVGPAVWMVQQFAAALQDGGDLGPDVEHGLAITRAIRAVEVSAQLGRSVRVDELPAPGNAQGTP